MMYSYEEIVEQLKEGKRVEGRMVPGHYLFMLLHDKQIKAIKIDGKLYEMNFIPIEEVPARCYYITEDNCMDIFAAERFIKEIVKTVDQGYTPSICLNKDEYFNIILELLETDE